MKKLLITVVALFAASSSAHAQSPTLITHLQHAQTNRSTLSIATIGDTLEGKVSTLTDSTLVIDQQLLRIADIRSLHERVESKSGTTVGAIVGGLTIGALGYMISGLCASDCTDDRIRGASAGALTGGVLGAMIGSLFDKSRDNLQHIWTLSPDQ